MTKLRRHVETVILRIKTRVGASILFTGELLKRYGGQISSTLNLVVSVAAALYAFLGYKYVVLDHQAKPHLDLVFSNRTRELTTAGNDVGGGYRHVVVDVLLRDQGIKPASNVAAHFFIDQDLADDENGGDFQFHSLPGVPISYEAVRLFGSINPSVPYPVGRLDFTLPAGTYTIATEIDCAECELPSSDKLLLTVDKRSDM